jgi:hypothetical protein
MVNNTSKKAENDHSAFFNEVVPLFRRPPGIASHINFQTISLKISVNTATPYKQIT